jgi:hypothetical protein
VLFFCFNKLAVEKPQAQKKIQCEPSLILTVGNGSPRDLWSSFTLGVTTPNYLKNLLLNESLVSAVEFVVDTKF